MRSLDLDIASNRRAQKWTKRELIVRALWETISIPLFAWTPWPLWGWRRGILRMFGAEIGAHVHIHPTVRIVIPWNVTIEDQASIGDRAIVYALGKVRIGRTATVSQNAHLCAGSHDFRSAEMTLLKASIEIEEGAWICADAFIGPDVRVGAYAVVGARSVVMKDVLSKKVVAGNPAKIVSER